MASKVGAQVAVIQNGKILLVQREDFEVWALPGGYIDAGESSAMAAVREAKEETGLDVRLMHIVGVYSTPEFIGTTLNDHVILYAAEVVGGTLRGQPEETINIGFFGPDEIPTPLVNWNERRIRDALNGARGLSVRTHVKHNALFNLSRPDFYAARDEECARLGISRAEFFNKHVQLGDVVDEL